MKKLFLTSIMAISLLITPTKKAEAGFLVITMSPFPSSHEAEDLMVMGALASFVGGAVLAITKPTFWGITGAALLIILDADGKLKEEKIKRDLSTIYPFIDNDLAIGNLAKVVKSKIPEELRADETFQASLSEREIAKALEGVELTAEQQAKIVKDLK